MFSSPFKGDRDEPARLDRSCCRRSRDRYSYGYGLSGPVTPRVTPRSIATVARLLRGRGIAPAEVPEAPVDPQLGQLLLRAVLREPPAQGAEIDTVDVLVLVEAGENDRLGAARRVVMALQALRADLLHHALHRRVDRGDRAVVRAEIALQHGAAGLTHRRHHAVRADRDDAVHLR